MLRPALDSFQQVMERLKAEEPEIYAALGTAGALCARHVRGSPARCRRTPGARRST